MKKKKVIVIGAGVIGSSISRELCKYELDVTLIEKNVEAGLGVTKANSAIIHGGYDDEPGTVRSKFCATGNSMYENLCEELGVDYKRIGSYVLGFKEEDGKYLSELFDKSKTNGIPGCEIHSAEKVKEREPNVSEKVIGGFWCPTAAITEPWMIAMAAVENGRKNGLKTFFEEKVIDIRTVETEGYAKVNGVQTDKAFYEADVVINCAGVYADEIVSMAGTEDINLHPRKGEYVLLDKKQGELVNSIIFPVPDKKSKGILVLPTIDGGLLLGPTAEDLAKEDRNEKSTTMEGIKKVIESTFEMIKGIDLSLTVKTFAGLRPETPQKDFVVGLTSLKGFINAAAMRSPGLTSAPAIAKYIAEKVVPDSLGFKPEENKKFDPVRKKEIRPADLEISEWEKLIEEDESYGRIVCLCNKITEREIIDAVRNGATTVEGVKFHTRASFGRCQGGFCLPKIVEIISRETGIGFEDIKMSGTGTQILDGKVRK